MQHDHNTPPMGNNELASKILDLPASDQDNILNLIDAMLAKDYDALRLLAENLPDESRLALLAHIDEMTGEPAGRHVNIKFSATTLLCSLAHPQAKPGLTGDVTIYRVTGIPAGVGDAHVLYLLDNTAILFPEKLPVPYTVDYSQLGYGKLVKGGVFIRADQVKPGMVFKCTSYPGAGVRTCRNAWKRPTGGETLMVIDCGEGISPLQLVLSDELEVLP